MHGSDEAYAPSIASTDGDNDDDDNEEDESASEVNSDANTEAPTELQGLFNKALLEYARIERARARDLRQFEQLQKRHDLVVQQGAELGQELEQLKAKLSSSDAVLTDMHVCLAHFLETCKPADE